MSKLFFTDDFVTFILPVSTLLNSGTHFCKTYGIQCSTSHKNILTLSSRVSNTICVISLPESIKRFLALYYKEFYTLSRVQYFGRLLAGEYLMSQGFINYILARSVINKKKSRYFCFSCFSCVPGCCYYSMQTLCLLSIDIF